MDEQKLQAEEMRTTLLQQLDNGEADMQRLTDYFALRKAANRLKESASTRRGKQ